MWVLRVFLNWGKEKLRLLKRKERGANQERKPGAAFIRQSNRIQLCRPKKILILVRILSELQIYSETLVESERLNRGYLRVPWRRAGIINSQGSNQAPQSFLKADISRPSLRRMELTYWLSSSRVNKWQVGRGKSMSYVICKTNIYEIYT